VETQADAMTADSYSITQDDPRYYHADVPAMTVAQLRAELGRANACPYMHPAYKWWLARAAEVYKELDRRDGHRRPAEGPEPPPRAPRPSEPPQAKPPEPQGWTVTDLLTADFPEPKWVVPGLIPTGLSVLAGRPKVGKSWLALQIAVAVASGGYALGEQVESGPVVYLALEDAPRRLKSRLELMNGLMADLPVTFYTDWPSLSDTEGLLALEARIVADEPRLVVIDTVTRAFGGAADWNDVAQTTAALAQLQAVALEQDCAILLIDHLRKGNGFLPDVVDDLLGSTGKAATVDTVIGLYRQRGERGATLRMTGRDIEERELAVEWDSATGCWQLLGDAQEVARQSVQGAIVEALQALGGASTVTELAAHIDRDKSLVSRELAELVHKGIVKRGQRQGREVPYLLTSSIVDMSTMSTVVNSQQS